MPVMPRMSGKARKIAYKILGKPANMENVKSKKKSKLNKRLTFEETQQVK